MKRKIHTSFHRPDLKFIFRLFKKRILKTEAESLPSSRLEVWAVQPTLSLRGLTPHRVATQGRSGIFPGMRRQEGGSLQDRGHANWKLTKSELYKKVPGIWKSLEIHAQKSPVYLKHWLLCIWASGVRQTLASIGNYGFEDAFMYLFHLIFRKSREGHTALREESESQIQWPERGSLRWQFRSCHCSANSQTATQSEGTPRYEGLRGHFFKPLRSRKGASKMAQRGRALAAKPDDQSSIDSQSCPLIPHVFQWCTDTHTQTHTSAHTHTLNEQIWLKCIN